MPGHRAYGQPTILRDTHAMAGTDVTATQL